MLENFDLKEMIKSCAIPNKMKLEVKQGDDNYCYMTSKKNRDVNLKVRKVDNKFTVEFYCSTYDMLSVEPVSYENVVKGLTMLLSTDIAPNDDELCDLLNW